jgi:hypothetical protein
VKFDDSELGRFTLNRRVDWFVADVRWNETNAELALSAGTIEEARAALVTAHALWTNQPDWDRRVRGYAAEELLPLKNESWLDEDESELTEAADEGRMMIKTITVDVDGSFGFWFADGDLFWGHAIHVDGSLTDGPTNAQIAG